MYILTKYKIDKKRWNNKQIFVVGGVSSSFFVVMLSYKGNDKDVDD
jgi:hypothetical protein